MRSLAAHVQVGRGGNRCLIGEEEPDDILAGAEETLLKLGEDRESEGLFGAVGFGSRSPFAVQFRFYCRAIGTFLATVTREVPGFEKMPEALNAQLRNKEYQAVWDTVQFAVSTINNPSSTMTTLPTFHQGLVYRLFPTTSYLHSAL